MCKTKKLLCLLLAVVMMLGIVAPVTVSAVEAGVEALNAAETEEWSAFLANLKVLENYASVYAAANDLDADGLIINYIRTGIEKYTDSEWTVLAGAENTAFTAYVKAQDELYGTTASALRGINRFTIPNGQTLEFAHMFGALNIAYYNNGASANVDLGSWAGDIVDLMEYVYKNVELTATDVEGMITEIRENHFGVDHEGHHSFGYMDLYGDLDSYYLYLKLTNTSKSMSAIVEGYFDEDLTDTYRAAFFLKNRFPGENTKEGVRAAVLKAYKANSGCSLLEADRGVDAETDLRIACCYAFADYLFELAENELPEDNTLYEVFSSTYSTIAPGITQEISYATTADDKQMVYYIAKADINRSDVNIYANYNNHDGSTWAMSRVTDQMAAIQAEYSDPTSDKYIENYNAVVGVNADFYNMSTGRPSGAFVMEGVTYQGVGNENFFAILKDGTPVIGGKAEWELYKDEVQEAVGASILLVKDGKFAFDKTNTGYYGTRASRTCVGITEDGEIVLLVVDGRQAPFSSGATSAELAQLMLEAGCVIAVNLDGGGSTTYAAKQEGADQVTVVNSPSDGYERSVSTSLVVVSTAETSTEFDHARITSEYEYMTVGTSIPMTATGVSKSGNAAEIPAEAVWTTDNSAIATVDENGVVTAVARGDVTVQLMLDGAVVGSRTLHVIRVPDGLRFSKENMNLVYGVATELPLVATYNENPVAINPSDVGFEFSADNPGVMDGFAFIGDENSGIRNLMIYAYLYKDVAVDALMTVALYKNGEAIFDFDNPTAGDRQFAWNRFVDNATTADEKLYQIVDPAQSFEISYVFALDMEATEVPEVLKPLMDLVAGGDVEGASAWQIMLQLAERINPMTNVKVTMQVDPNLDIDVSNVKLVNDYFTLTGTDFDEETHTLTMTCNFIKQSQAIDPMTANSICIVSGIKATPKADAAWDENGQLAITNTGNLTYDIYLRAGALYSFACSEENQQVYGIYPFVDTVINPTYNAYDKGGHFENSYANFTDSFVLCKNAFEGWVDKDNALFYYENNVPVTGIHNLPGYEDEANSYYYSFDENGVCIGKVTGLFTLDGDLYYAINGELKTGWRGINSGNEDVDFYYFDPTTGKAVNGKAVIDWYHFTFVDYVLTEGEVVTTSDGRMHYRWANFWKQNEWVEANGKKYYALYDHVGYGWFAKGVVTVCEYGGIDRVKAVFGDDYAWLENYNGMYTTDSGVVYLVENGYVIDFPGLVKIDGDYYYFREYSGMTCDKSVWVSKTNGLLPEGMYTFDSEGKMVLPEKQNGIVSENGKLYYYVDGVRTYGGLVEIDGAYYYANSSGVVVTGRSYWVTKTNGLVPEGSYTFDADGKMVNPPIEMPTEPETTVPTEPETTTPVEPETTEPETEAPVEPDVKNGIYEENGKLYYYQDGKIFKNGLFELDGNYYYARTSNGQLICGRSYWITRTNGLLPLANYRFDADGKILNLPETEPDVTEPVEPDVTEPVEPETPTEPVEPDTPVEPDVKNGIYEEDGKLYYYEDGAIVKCGLFELDGYFYYARTTNGELIRNRKYWPTKTNGLLPQQTYTFDENGRIVF